MSGECWQQLSRCAVIDKETAYTEDRHGLVYYSVADNGKVRIAVCTPLRWVHLSEMYQNNVINKKLFTIIKKRVEYFGTDKADFSDICVHVRDRADDGEHSSMSWLVNYTVKGKAAVALKPKTTAEDYKGIQAFGTF